MNDQGGFYLIVLIVATMITGLYALWKFLDEKNDALATLAISVVSFLMMDCAFYMYLEIT